MEEKQREINVGIKDLEIELKLIKFKEENKEVSAYIKIIDNASRELKELICEKELNSINKLQREVEEQKNKQENKDQLALEVCQLRGYEDNVDIFVEKRINSLKALKLKEQTIVKIIANTVWPGNERTRIRLAEAESLDLLKILIREEKQRIARLQKDKTLNNYKKNVQP